MVQLKQQCGSEEGLPEPTRGNVCSVSRQRQRSCFPPLQGRGVMRTCTTLLGSDRALRNPRAGMGWSLEGGWEPTSMLPMDSHHLLLLSRAVQHPLQQGWGAGKLKVIQGTSREGAGVQFGRAVPLLPCLPQSRASKGLCGLGPSTTCGQEPFSPQLKVRGRCAGGAFPSCSGGDEPPPSSPHPSSALAPQEHRHLQLPQEGGSGLLCCS